VILWISIILFKGSLENVSLILMIVRAESNELYLFLFSFIFSELKVRV